MSKWIVELVVVMILFALDSTLEHENNTERSTESSSFDRMLMLEPSFPQNKGFKQCNSEASDTIRKKEKTDENVWNCCYSLYLAQCLIKYCATDSSDEICIFHFTWDVNKCSEKICTALPNKPFDWLWLLYLVAASIAVAILILIGVVCYKKFYKNDHKKGKKSQITVGTQMNVSSRADHGSHHTHSRSKTKGIAGNVANSDSEIKANQKNSMVTSVNKVNTSLNSLANSDSVIKANQKNSVVTSVNKVNTSLNPSIKSDSEIKINPKNSVVTSVNKVNTTLNPSINTSINAESCVMTRKVSHSTIQRAVA